MIPCAVLGTAVAIGASMETIIYVSREDMSRFLRIDAERWGQGVQPYTVPVGSAHADTRFHCHPRGLAHGRCDRG
jgi:hypothetical protein